jgi:MFS family permease
MSISPVPRNVASATYGFVRFIGGGLAPFAAGLLAEHLDVRVPFLLGALVVLGGAVLLQTVRARPRPPTPRRRGPARRPKARPRRRADRCQRRRPLVRVGAAASGSSGHACFG